jgi:hypothetical protein
MEPSSIISVAERLGVSFAFLLLILWGGYKLFGWFGNKILLPLQERHIRFLDKLEMGLEKVLDTQNETLRVVAEIHKNTREMDPLERR